jgi:plastocyanin
MKRIFTFIAMFTFTAALLFGIMLRANAQIHAQTIIGEVTLVGQGTLKVKEDTSQTEYELTASPDKLKGVNTGYRVEAKTANGRVLSLTVLGMPTQAEAEPFQKFVVTKQGGQITNLRMEGKPTSGEPNEVSIVTAGSSPGTIIGEVTLVGETTLKVKEDTTQTEYELTASPDKLRDISTGYRVEVKTTNGRVLSLTVLGMPMKAETEPSQRFTVIKQGGQTANPMVGGVSVTGRPNETAVTIITSQFQPRDITIPVGTTVTWINRTPMQQGVAADDGSFAAVLKPGGSFSYGFTQVGRFSYYSQFYGNPGGRGMAGTITVVPAVQ